MFIDSTVKDYEPTSQHLEQRTRERVLAAVSEHGPITAAELGKRLGLTAAAVRRHLDGLAAHGAIAAHDPTGGRQRGRGRPARSWVVSDAGHESLAADYDGVATAALRFLADECGPEAVATFAREHVGTLETRYAGELADAGSEPADRADALVSALTRDGFAASARPVAGGGLTGIQLCQGHCPVKHVAEEFPQFCDAETDAFSRLLGVHVQRLATLARGHHVCTTFIPTGNTAATRVAAPGEPPTAPTATTSGTTRTKERSLR